MFKKSLAVMASVLLGSIAAQASTTFTFSGGTGVGTDCSSGTIYCTSLDYSQDGIDLTLYGAVWDGVNMDTMAYYDFEDAYYQVKVSESYGEYGLGIKNTPHVDSSHTIDGENLKDVMLFDFGSNVQIESVLFSAIWYEEDDDVTLFTPDGDGWVAGSTLAIQNCGGYGCVSFDPAWAGSSFGFGAMEADDDFRILAVTVSAIPEPSTWLMMILGFGMVGMATRRRRLMDVS